MMARQKIFGVIGLSMLMCALAGCNMDVEAPGEVPDVDVDAQEGEMPDVDVDVNDRGEMPDVDVDVKDEGRLPDVDVDVEQGEIPEVDVQGPDVDVSTE